jgi:hypothetical protein
MARLICTAQAPLDGYIADEHGNFDWAAPSDPSGRTCTAGGSTR